MSLLLDDEEVFVPPMKSTKLDVHVLNSDGDSAGTGKQPADADADLKGDSARANTSPSAATRTAYTPSRSNTAAAAAFIARKGGNGIEKMDALIFGMPKVFVSSGSAAAACQAPRTALALEDTLAASNCTPTTQKARSQASKLNTEGRSSASCNTQPKIVSGARSPSSLSSPSQRQVSVVSFGDSFPASQESTVEAHMAVVSPAKPGASPAASPPARPASKPSPPNSAETTPTQPAKTQMRLSDFFSKMACKR
ncbi:hypothetical protein ABL78_0030 [Leptomonas seymouri]|uniref:Uncharacterized protein n=1 Tax=Leptomonas seymouri TaxID=5684 RepID=A0A0N0P9J6_LEPSE|nr:hypothetical protein ABL78_0030 [Leptomonas seymouri]|eukprot:KPI90797.1 hypothetical protein ABL78_0030 [Leptomonas seymouri]